MNLPEIREVLRKKIQHFRSFLPEDLARVLDRDSYIAGGAIVSLVLDEKVQDYDLWFKTQESADQFFAYFKQMKEVTHHLRVKALTENGITIELVHTGEIFQLITRFTGPPDRVFKSFDYMHCMAYYDYAIDCSENGASSITIHCDEDLIKSKKLVYNPGEGYPVNAVKRMAKFVARGWTPTNDTILSLVDAIHELDWKNPKIQANQLIGFYGNKVR